MSAVASALETASPAPTPVRWPLPLRIAFRFFWCYWLLFSLPQSGAVSIFQAIPGGEWIWKPYIAQEVSFKRPADLPVNPANRPHQKTDNERGDK